LRCLLLVIVYMPLAKSARVDIVSTMGLRGGHTGSLWGMKEEKWDTVRVKANGVWVDS